MKKVILVCLFYAIGLSANPKMFSEKKEDGLYHLKPGHPLYQEQQKVLQTYSGDNLEHFFDENGYELRDQKWKCNMLRSRRQTGYHLWAQQGQTERIMEHYMEEKIPHIDVKDGTGYTPLAIAAWHGKSETCHALVSIGADPNSCNFFAGGSILHEVLHNTKHAPIKKGAPELYRQQLIRRRMTDAEALKVVKALNFYGELRVDIKNMHGRTPIEWLESNDMSFAGSKLDPERRELLMYLRNIRVAQRAERQEARHLSPRFAQWVPRLPEKSSKTVNQIIAQVPQTDVNGHYYRRVLDRKMEMDEVFTFLGMDEIKEK